VIQAHKLLIEGPLLSVGVEVHQVPKLTMIVLHFGSGSVGVIEQSFRLLVVADHARKNRG
jgi:hypothetical protein